MKRIYLISLALFIFLIPVVAVSGQTPTEPAPTPQPTADVAAIQALATEVANSAEQAKDAFDQATNFLGIFEAIGLIVAVLSGLITVLAVVGGLVGFRGLNTAQKDLNEARDRFEQEIKEKQDELSKVRQEMEASTEKQRQNAANANLALSLLTLGERQYRSQDFQGALDTYRRALELDPESLITHYRLGYVYTQSGVLEKAEYHLNRALEIEKNFAPALAALGYVSRRIGEKMPEGIERSQILNKAENLLLQGLAISHKLVDDDNESWWGSLGGLYRRRGQIDQAIMAYENAAAITPKSSYAFSNLALLYLQKENKEKMLKTYQRVEQLAQGEVSADVDNYWAYADLLTSRLALGKVAEAEPVLQSVLEIAPKDSAYVFEILLDTLNRLEKALGEADSAHLKPFIEQIEARVEEQRKRNNGA
ncbi:MAG: tetratricopeptide repeat protein [Anaerolineae bacterium]|nr:tetratricopeptide repeat protein [Anaerolineae bacterium]